MCFKKNAMLFIVLFSFLIVGNVWAGENGKSMRSSYSQDGWGKKEKKVKKIFDSLGLSDDQRKQLEVNKSKTRDAMKALRGQIKSYRDAIHQELMKTDLDMTKITEIQNQLKAVQSQMADARLNSILEVRKILNVDQFTKFNELMEKEKAVHESKEIKE